MFGLFKGTKKLKVCFFLYFYHEHLKEQVGVYEEEVEKHRASISTLEKQIRKIKEQLYSNLSSSENLPEEQLQQLTNFQSEIEKVHYEHFLAIKNICNKNQLENFEDLTKALAKIFS